MRVLRVLRVLRVEKMAEMLAFCRFPPVDWRTAQGLLNRD
jgi:hypothetical protein